jgi:hypothetical protein
MFFSSVVGTASTVYQEGPLADMLVPAGVDADLAIFTEGIGRYGHYLLPRSEEDVQVLPDQCPVFDGWAIHGC